MAIKAWEHTVVGTSDPVSKGDILQAIRRAKEALRPGIGTRSKILVCHPNNRKYLSALLHRVNDTPDLHVVYPYRIIENAYVPETSLMKTGNIVWHDTRLWTYSSGPTSNMTMPEYIKMCLYFGWAEEEYKMMQVFYEIDDNTFSTVLNSALLLQTQKKVEEKAYEKVAREMFAAHEPFFSNPAFKSLLTGRRP